MSKLYDFRFTIRKAQFDVPGIVCVPYGDSGDVYHESCEQMTFADAKEHLRRLSKAQLLDHAAFLDMKYRDDRKPPGFAKHQTIYHEAEQ